jgi:hypothetical protein
MSSGKLEPEARRVVSSAKSKAKSVVQRGRSLMYRRNRMGPRMEPCGTPNLMVCMELFTPFTHTNWDLSDR